MRAISEIFPRKVINIRKGEGSFLFIDMEPEGSAEVFLWIYMCDWTLIQKDGVITSDSIDDTQDLSRIFLGEIVSIEKAETTSEVHINFSSDIKLILSNSEEFYSGEDDYFMLFIGDSWVAKYSEQNGFSVKQQ